MQKRQRKFLRTQRETKAKKNRLTSVYNTLRVFVKAKYLIDAYMKTRDHNLMIAAIDIMAERSALLAQHIANMKPKETKPFPPGGVTTEAQENALVDVMGAEEFAKADTMVCHMCGALVDPESVCDRCDEFVCFECQKHGDAMTCIEEIRCKDCHESMIDNG